MKKRIAEKKFAAPLTMLMDSTVRMPNHEDLCWGCVRNQALEISNALIHTHNPGLVVHNKLLLSLTTPSIQERWRMTL
ncbi:hypothetical protein KP509_28G043400 [Ceratopteris richardii]|uniref:Uncharacterized protein n=1 Tax=Ceratopteris richardii TaxID=49495 RepID=A0A8T2RBL8_CERRI|nr:hypothetical protein KP509_28G043400 [Ceratopteris richardii]